MKKKNKKILLFVLTIVLIYALGGVIFIFTNRKPNPIKISNLDSIKGYDLVLKSNATDVYKKEFKELKNNLESKDINEEEYAKSLAKLFIIDLYSISNKINKYDIETMYVYPDYRDNYKLNVQNTLYKYVEDNSNKNRNQELPEVSSIEVTSYEPNKFKLGDIEFDGYKVKLSWTYLKDLGYDHEGEVILIKKDNKCYVVEKN